MSNHLLNHMPKHVSKHRPGCMSKHMSMHMSKHMSQHMHMCKVLMTDLQPAQQVIDAMNEINTARRNREAATFRAEACLQNMCVDMPADVWVGMCVPACV